MDEEKLSYPPLMDEAIETVRAFGSADASEHALKIQFVSQAGGERIGTQPCSETLSEKIERVRGMVRGRYNGDECKRAIEALPECAEKHYLATIVELRQSSRHTIQDTARSEIEQAWAMDQKNPVYEELIMMIEREYSQKEAEARRARDKQRGIVSRLARRTGLG